MSNETLTNQRELFDIPPGLTYLNCAFTSPQQWPVIEAGQRAVARKARPWEIGPSHFFDEVEEPRFRFASLVRAEADGVAIVPSVSYGMATAAAQIGVPAGAEILAGPVPIQRLCVEFAARRNVAGAPALVAVDRRLRRPEPVERRARTDEHA